MTNTERIQANNAELREAIELAETLPDAEGGSILDAIASASIEGNIVLGVSSIEPYSFYGNTKIESVSAPNVTSIGKYAFYGCSGKFSLSVPNVTSLGEYAFATSGITSVVLRSVTEIPNRCFNSCQELTKADFWVAEKINTYGLYYCRKLEAVILRNKDAVVTITSLNAVQSSGSAFFYVPSALIEEYKVATNWSNYADRFRAIEDYPDITGG